MGGGEDDETRWLSRRIRSLALPGHQTVRVSRLESKRVKKSK